jgi:hypothetical protein
MNRWGKMMQRWHAGRVLSPTPDKDGYLRVCAKGMGGNKTVHRLVAAAFHRNPKRLPQVNHKNGRVDDNRPSNLEWCTNSQNHLHAVHVLGRKPNVQPSIPVLLTNQWGAARRFSSTKEAAEYLDVVPTAVSNAIRNKTLTKKHKAQYV